MTFSSAARCSCIACSTTRCTLQPAAPRMTAAMIGQAQTLRRRNLPVACMREEAQSMREKRPMAERESAPRNPRGNRMRNREATGSCWEAATKRIEPEGRPLCYPPAVSTADFRQHVRPLRNHGDLRRRAVFGERIGHGRFDARRRFDEQPVERFRRQAVAHDLHLAPCGGPWPALPAATGPSRSNRCS